MAVTPPAGAGWYVVNAVADLVRTHITSEETTIQAFLRLQQALRDAAMLSWTPRRR